VMRHGDEGAQLGEIKWRFLIHAQCA